MDNKCDDQRLITVREAAAMFGCSQATFWRRVADGTFPAPIRIRGLTRWVKSDLDSFISDARSAWVQLRPETEQATGEQDA
jgi:predicted DNA-binding transcriptional regulator AlpA